MDTHETPSAFEFNRDGDDKHIPYKKDDDVGAPNYAYIEHPNPIGSSFGPLQSDSQHGGNKDFVDNSNWFQIIPPDQALMWACNPSLINTHVQHSGFLLDENIQ